MSPEQCFCVTDVIGVEHFIGIEKSHKDDNGHGKRRKLQQVFFILQVQNQKGKKYQVNKHQRFSEERGGINHEHYQDGVEGNSYGSGFVIKGENQEEKKRNEKYFVELIIENR